jgi:AcrR family transcriptional regulator
MAGVRPLGGATARMQTSNARSPCVIADCDTCRRLRTAAVALAVRGGIQDVTLEAIAVEAGVAPERAAEHYPTLDHCLTAAFEAGTARFREATDRALDREGSWEERMHAAAEATVEELEACPELARFCVVEACRSNLPRLRASRLAVRRRWVEMLNARRRAAGVGDLPEVRMELLVGAGHHLTGEELERGDPEALHERLDGLIEVFERSMRSRTV